MASVTALRRWLTFVAALRLLSVYIGYFAPDKFKTALVTEQPDLANELFSRVFGTWTLLTCMLCLLCAKDPHNKAVYGATLLSFVIAIAFFLSEVLLYKTISWKGATTPFIIATTSTVWMGLGYRYYTFYSALPEAGDSKVKRS